MKGIVSTVLPVRFSIDVSIRQKKSALKQFFLQKKNFKTCLFLKKKIHHKNETVHES